MNGNNLFCAIYINMRNVRDSRKIVLWNGKQYGRPTIVFIFLEKILAVVYKDVSVAIAV